MPQKPTPSPFRTREFKRSILTDIAAWLIAVVILLWVKKEPARIIIPLAVILYIFWWLFHLKSRVLAPLREWRAAIQKVVDFQNMVNAAQTVRVHLVKAEAVVQVTHDDGTVCLFDLGENQIYWIDPYDLIPGRAPAKWPNSEFEVVQIPGRTEEFGPFCLGKKLKPKETYEFDDLFACFDYEPPADGIINQSLDDFVKDAEAKNLANSEKINS